MHSRMLDPLARVGESMSVCHTLSSFLPSMLFLSPCHRSSLPSLPHSPSFLPWSLRFFSLSLSLDSSEASSGGNVSGHSPISCGVCPGACGHRQDKDPGQDKAHECAGRRGWRNHTADWSHICSRGRHPNAN